MTEKNILLGHWTCERGGRAEVRQTKKAGRHFYTHCECCGLNQGTGAKRQQEIYDGAEFIAGVTVVRPSSVNEKAARVVDDQPKKEPEKIGAPVRDFDPTLKADEPEVEPASSKGFSAFIPGLIFVVAAGVGIWMG